MGAKLDVIYETIKFWVLALMIWGWGWGWQTPQNEPQKAPTGFSDGPKCAMGSFVTYQSAVDSQCGLVTAQFKVRKVELGIVVGVGAGVGWSNLGYCCATCWVWVWKRNADAMRRMKREGGCARKDKDRGVPKRRVENRSNLEDQKLANSTRNDVHAQTCFEPAFDLT